MSQNPKTTAEFGEWIIWNGGECPVEDGVRGQICFAHNTFEAVEHDSELFNIGAAHWSDEWQHVCDPSDRIMAYRLLIEPEAQEKEVFWIKELDMFSTIPAETVGSRKAIITLKGDELSIRWAE